MDIQYVAVKIPYPGAPNCDPSSVRATVPKELEPLGRWTVKVVTGTVIMSGMPTSATKPPRIMADPS